MLDRKFFIENIKTLFYALIIAVIIRSLLIQPFYIPSSSMEPNLLVGDRLFVTKYSYGYSKHSFPFSPPVLKDRIFYSKPQRGDVVVFKTPSDNRTDYIKRLIGLPGDSIRFIDANLYLNNSEILKSKISSDDIIFCGKRIIDTFTFEEILPNGKKHTTVYHKNFPFKKTDEFIAAWLKSRRVEPKTLRSDKSKVTVMANEMPLLSDITKPNVRKWCLQMDATNKSIKTINSYLSACKEFWNYL